MRGRRASSVFSLSRPVLALIPFALIMLIGVMATLALVVALPASLALPMFAIQAAMLCAGLAMLGLVARRFADDSRREERAVRALFGNYQIRLQQMLDQCEADGRLITALQASGRAERTLAANKADALKGELGRVEKAIGALAEGRLRVRLKSDSPVAESFNDLSAKLHQMNDILTELEGEFAGILSPRLFERPARLQRALLADQGSYADDVVVDRKLEEALAKDAQALSRALRRSETGSNISDNPLPAKPSPQVGAASTKRDERTFVASYKRIAQ